MNGIHEAQTCADALNVNHSIGIERKFIIYKITNLVNRKIYIGQTAQPLKRRRQDHIKYAFRRDSQQAIHRAMRKHGIDNFLFETLLYCFSKDHMDQKEIELIHLLASKSKHIGYNMTDGGEGTLGRIIREDTRDKIRIANLGKKQSAEQRAKYNRVGPNNPNWGKTMSPETRAKIAARAKLWNRERTNKGRFA
jgi:group I intron endonuclease